MVETVGPKTRMDWLTETSHNTPGGSSNARPRAAHRDAIRLHPHT
jgi:hypothetical protein